jgi:SAM-dependent methyltransferase
MNNKEIRRNADYQKFTIVNGQIQEIGSRMLQKIKAMEPILPDWKGKTVLDIGCDFGFWSFLAASKGAMVLGLDRSRDVRGIGPVDLIKLNNETAHTYALRASFAKYEVGREWRDFKPFDIVLLMSLYHHIYQVTGGDHESIWYWLRNITKTELIWENPLSLRDGVASKHISAPFRQAYNETEIRQYAEKYFDIVYEGPAGHVSTRTLWKLVPKQIAPIIWEGNIRKGAGGATPAFLYNDKARIHEIKSILGITPIPGSLNIKLKKDFDWDSKYYRADLLDVVVRGKGLSVPWGPRKVRFYPVTLNENEAWAMRFEGEKYPKNFVELISAHKLNTGIKQVHFTQ